jgi:hypothetical protein
MAGQGRLDAEQPDRVKSAGAQAPVCAASIRQIKISLFSYGYERRRALESRLPRQRSRWQIALEDAVHHLWADKNPILFTSWDIHPGFGYRGRQI